MKSQNKKKLSLAEQFAEENNLDIEINQAYINNVGEQYAKAEDVEEAYSGQFASDEEFAKNMAEQLDEIDFKNQPWPYYHIDWDSSTRDLMMDYFEQDGYYFRNL